MRKKVLAPKPKTMMVKVLGGCSLFFLGHAP
jgi:hypothetical protein